MQARPMALELDGDIVRDVRIGLGGVATIPWRAHKAEQALLGKRLNEASATAAASTQNSRTPARASRTSTKCPRQGDAGAFAPLKRKR